MTETTPWAKSGMRILGGRYVTLEKPRISENVILVSAKEVGSEDRVVVMRPTARLMAYPSFAYQLERAALELTDVRHENLVTVLDVRREEGVPCVVAEHVDGPTLNQLIEEGGGCLEPEAVQPWLEAVASALDFIHKQKTVHGEVRPGHILQDASGVWKLTDLAFATARDTLDKGLQSVLVSKRPGFTAPEIIAGGAPTAATDQYSLAACVYMALVGEPPTGDLEVAARALREHLTIDGAVYLLRALSPNPGRRYRTCATLAEAIGKERERRDLQAQLDQAMAGEGADEPAVDVEPEAEETPEIRCWRLRLGLRDEHAAIAREGGFVALGWTDLGALENLGESRGEIGREDLIDRYEETYGQGGLAAAVTAGQIWRFQQEMQAGDLVLVPDPAEGRLHIGEVSGGVTFVRHPADDCPLPRRRDVSWVADVPLESIPPALIARLVGTKPLVDLDADRACVKEVLEAFDDGGGTGREEALLQTVKAALAAAPDEAFLSFLQGLFGALRYDTDLWLGGEGRWEAVGTLAGDGLVEVPLRVTVYRNETPLDSDVVFTARGTLALEEHAAILALGGFSERAQAEATEDGKKPVRLIDGSLLAALALEAWEDLRPADRDLLGVDRIEEVTIDVRYRSRPESSTGGP